MDKPLKLYRLIPIAADDNPNWTENRMVSVFRNEKLYTVIEVNNGKEYREHGVVDGTVGVDTIIFTQV